MARKKKESAGKIPEPLAPTILIALVDEFRDKSAGLLSGKGDKKSLQRVVQLVGILGGAGIGASVLFGLLP